MSYVTQSHANRPAAIAGVVGIHAALGALIVLGLSTKVAEILEEPQIDTFDVQPTIPPPPPPQTKPQPDQKTPAPPIYVPPVAPVLPPKPSFVDTTTTLPPLSDDVLLNKLPLLPDIGPAVTPGLTPVAASPRNRPSRWVTDNDYKSRWVREGLSGTASFRLEVTASGKVESCAITRSTGHKALDDATCALITRRARFDPATNSSGAAVRGSYSSAINWKLPE